MEKSLKEQLNVCFREASEAMKREDYHLAEQKYHELTHLSLLLFSESKEREDKAEYYSLAREYSNKESYARKYRIDKEELKGVVSHTPLSEFVGEEKAKRFLMEDIIIPMKNGEFVKRKKNGLFIYGPHGVGKTALVSAIGYELQAEIFPIGPLLDFRMDNFPDAVNSVLRIIKASEKEERAILFMEDPLCYFPKGEEDTTSEEISTLFLDLFRKEMRKARRRKLSLLFVTTTDCPDKLDPRIFDEGLFDDFLRIDLPDEKTRELLIRKYTTGLDENTLRELVKASQGYPSRQLTSILESKDDWEKMTEEEAVHYLLSQEKENDSGFFENIDAFEKRIK